SADGPGHGQSGRDIGPVGHQFARLPAVCLVRQAHRLDRSHLFCGPDASSSQEPTPGSRNGPSAAPDSKKTRKYITSQKGLNVFYLPKSPPDWNPNKKTMEPLERSRAQCTSCPDQSGTQGPDRTSIGENVP